jgi:prepilin-type N-terminal cleavage/methylation domain-containing protein
MSRLKVKKGTTLIELVMVIAIIGILSAASIVSFVNYRRQSALESASLEMVAVLREAQNYALSGKDINATNCVSYTVTAFNALPSTDYILRNPAGCGLLYSYSLKNGTTFSVGGSIVFNIPHGRLNTATNSFRITNGTTNYYNICVNGAGLIYRKFNSGC